MANTAALPPLDKRTAADILAELAKRGVALEGLGGALAQIFARYGETLVDRINRAPDKNFLAYLNLLGNTLLAPEPAEAPLTFSLAAGTQGIAVVPAGTQVASQLLPGEQKPVLFETERELAVAPVQIVHAIARDARTDLDQDVSALADPSSTAVFPAFQGASVMVHDLYIALPDILFEPPLASSIFVIFTIAPGQFTGVRELVWESWDGTEGLPLNASADETNRLTGSGQVRLDLVYPEPKATVNGLTARWIRCRWRTAISSGPSRPGMIPESNLPVIQDIQVSSACFFDNSCIQAAFFNDRPVDLSKDFLPLGERPRIGDTFYLMSPAFSRDQNYPMLHFVLSDSYAVTATGTPVVNWEFWGGASWLPINMDLTRSFTVSNYVNALISGNPQPRSINNLFGYWARARLSAGNYGQDAHVSATNTVVQADLAPPSYKSMTVGGAMTVAGQPPVAVMTCNDWVFENRALPFVPFRAATETTLSLGFAVPAGQAFPNRTISLYVAAASRTYGSEPLDNPAPVAPAHLTWQYWNGKWSSLTAGDGTSGLLRDGWLEFLAPPDFTPHFDAGSELYWLRALWDSGDYEIEPRLRRILPNTVAAIQAITLRNEILGSSSGAPGQIFNAARSPILPGQQLQVREPALPSGAEQLTILLEEGSDAIVQDGGAVWVRWHEVPDFYGSGPVDRHYVVDRLAGQIQFGDGRSGRIPLAGSNNIRLVVYRTGGGPEGNRPAANLTQLKTTVPYVDRVTNYEPATGGAPAEDLPSLQARGPRTVRHGGRAVTAEDYEDLAKLASPAVVRAKCAPLRDLEASGNNQIPGHVSLIVVPRSTDARPAPEIVLLEDVQNYVDAHRIPTADLTVVGPPFVRVDVTVTVVLTSLELSGDVEPALQAALARYLHPLTGARGGAGWDFGRQPHQSELYVLAASVPGVKYVKVLATALTEEPAGALLSGYFLVYSGTHTVTMLFEG